MKKLLKFVGIVLVVIFIIFIANTCRKYVILSSLYEKAEETINLENFYKKIYSYGKNNYIETQIYGLGNKRKIVTKQLTEKGLVFRTIYATITEQEEIDKYMKNAKGISNTYIEENGIKTATLNKELNISVDPQNALYANKKWQLFFYAMRSSAKKSVYYGEECYYIKNLDSPYFFEDNGTYISKENGMVIGTEGYEFEYYEGGKDRSPATSVKYEFGTVTEKDFIEPNIDEYKVQ